MPELDEILPLPTVNTGVSDFLKDRRSNLAKAMGEPGPSEAQLDELLTIAARVPDHRKLAPWRFMIFQGQARSDFGQHIASAFMKSNPDMPADRAIFEGQRFLRAPLVVAVISSPKACALSVIIFALPRKPRALARNGSRNGMLMMRMLKRLWDLPRLKKLQDLFISGRL